VPANINTSGGDVVVLQPTQLLHANTKYHFRVTEGVKDTTGAFPALYQQLHHALHSGPALRIRACSPEEQRLRQPFGLFQKGARRRVPADGLGEEAWTKEGIGLSRPRYRPHCERPKSRCKDKVR
jgi:hypothetical protein